MSVSVLVMMAPKPRAICRHTKKVAESVGIDMFDIKFKKMSRVQLGKLANATVMLLLKQFHAVGRKRFSGRCAR